MVKNLIRYGKDLALILDEDTMARLGIDENTPLEVVAEGRSLHITARSQEDEDAALNRSMDAIEDEYAEVFKKLAE